MLNEVCIGENIRNFREGSSCRDLKCAVESLVGTEQVSDSIFKGDNDSSKSVDEPDLSGADVREGGFSSEDANVLSIAGFQEGSSAIDIKPNDEPISDEQKLSDPVYTGYDDFCNSFDAPCVDGVDILDGSCTVDNRPTFEMTSVTQQSPVLSCIEDDSFSKGVNAHVLYGDDFLDGSSDINIMPAVERISDPSCTWEDDFSKSVDILHLSSVDFQEASSFDIKCAVEESALAQEISGAISTENNDTSKTQDDKGLSGGGYKEELSLVDYKLMVEDLSQSKDSHDLSRSDVGEQVTSPDIEFRLESFSVSQHMFEPSCVGVKGFSTSSDAPLGGDELFATTDSIHSSGRFGENDSGGKCAKVDDASEGNLHESMSAPSQKRNLRNTRSRQNAQPARNRQKVTNKKVSLNLDSFHIIRKRRSCSTKRARSSVWGMLMDVQGLEHNGRADISLNEHKKPVRIRGSQARGSKKKKSPTCSKKSNEKSCRPAGRISLKIKIGKGMGPSSVIDASSADNNIERTEEKFPGISKEVKSPRNKVFQGCEENLDSILTCANDSMLDFNLSDQSLAENRASKSPLDSQQLMYEKEIDRKGTLNDIRGLDSGTSPDSEVINLSPCAPDVGRGPEDLHDILSSKPHVASEDVTSLSPIQSMKKEKKKKKKKKKMLQAGDDSPKDKLLSSEILVNQLTEIEQRDKDDDITCLTETSASATIANASGSTSSKEGMSKETLDKEINLSSVNGNEFESSVTQSSKEAPRRKGQKTSKSAKKEGIRDKQTEVSARSNERESTSRKKVTRDKSVTKLKLKEKVKCGLTSGEGEVQVQTGNPKLSDNGESLSGNPTLTGDKATTEIAPGGVEQYMKPRNAWVLCDDCHKWRRIPAMLADQIEDTNCRWTCKDNTDKNFADCSVPQEKSNAEINAELEISDGSCDEDACEVRRNANQPRKNESSVEQQSKWRLIKSNLFLHRSRKTQTIDEIMVCHCKPPSDGRMGCGDGCLNRMLNIECVRGTCPCGELCSNQQFQKRKYSKLECFKCGKKGYGLKVLEDISEGNFLIEYVGEVLDMHTYEARQREYALNGHRHFYFMTLNGSEVIDACSKGNLGRFINHSCDPNCRTEKWMVNGEVCVGLFALRNIKKGEELTFDYNYVRVFGAAAKKCVCGSPHCRGYIGGDPQNPDVIVQDDSDDEYPEPVMVSEDDVSEENLNDKMSARTSFDEESLSAKESPEDMDKSNKFVGDLDVAPEPLSTENKVAEEVEIGPSAVVIGHTEAMDESGDSLSRSTSALKLDAFVDMEGQLQSLARAGTPFKLDGSSTENMSIGEQEVSTAERSMKKSPPSIAGLDAVSPSMLSKLSPGVMDKRKLKFGFRKSKVESSTTHPLVKTSRSSPSVKKEKPKSLPVASKKLDQIHKFDPLSSKSKKIVEGSPTGRFEAVQEKLNELLDQDGGISKRRDSSRGYLKLLLLTAASGDSGVGEAIQSNRDLSMILDALLKTKSKTVLVDIINKNGLQMLHNMLKRYRKEFRKIPILRKLLKVFEYLATREILTSEHINGGPPRPGVESFRESILSFTEHTDKQVHQIARNFRDKWIPRHARKHNCKDWEDGKFEGHRCPDYSKFSVHNRLSNRSGRHSETPQSVIQSSAVDAGTEHGSCLSSSTRTRKRKSRWDQPADMDPRVETDMASDGSQNMDDDAPPGFATPLNVSATPSEVSSHGHDIEPNIANDIRQHEVVLGKPQQRFISRLSVSYGIPLSTVEQVGTPQPGIPEGWSVAPGMPFNPFPPLPPYPREKRDALSNASDSAMTGQHEQLGEKDDDKVASHPSGPNPQSSSTASLPDVEMSGETNGHNFQQARGSNTLGRKYFRQQKWNNSKLGPPWIRNRSNWTFMGNTPRNGMYDAGFGPNGFRNSHGFERLNGEMDHSAYHHHRPQQY